MPTPGPTEVLWFRLVPPLPGEPFPPHPLPSHQLVQRPRTEHLLAIQGEGSRAQQQAREADAVAGLCALRPRTLFT